MRTIAFAGHEWDIKEASKAGPGPNAFSSREEDIFVDEQGLHLRSAFIGDRWHATEAVLNKPLGWGTYAFSIAGGLASLPNPHVFAGFLYQDDQHELDIEFSREMVSGGNAQFAVQPWWLLGHRKAFRFDQDGAADCLLAWLPDRVEFEVASGSTAKKWGYAGHFKPDPAVALFIFNLWLYKGRPAEKPAEIIVTSFSFEPY